jgi:hypothetical protein
MINFNNLHKDPMAGIKKDFENNPKVTHISRQKDFIVMNKCPHCGNKIWED